jgi:CBS-domain-containing membrane protein
VAGDLGVDELIRDYLWRYRCSAFPVVGADHRPTGLVTLSRLRELADDARASLRVHQVATPIERVAVARPDEPVVDLVARLGPGTGRRALVVDAGGDLVGIVTGSDLDRVLEVAAAVGAGAGAAP